MLGREAYHNPWLMAELDTMVFGSGGVPTRHDAVRTFLSYAETELERGTRLPALTRHLLGLFRGQPGGRAWRRHLSTLAHRPGAGLEVLVQALRLVPEKVARHELVSP